MTDNPRAEVPVTQADRETAERMVEVVARSICCARGIGPGTLHQHYEWDDFPADERREYKGLDGEDRVMLMHFAWRKRANEARAAIAAYESARRRIASSPDHSALIRDLVEALGDVLSTIPRSCGLGIEAGGSDEQCGAKSTYQCCLVRRASATLAAAKQAIGGEG